MSREEVYKKEENVISKELTILKAHIQLIVQRGKRYLTYLNVGECPNHYNPWRVKTKISSTYQW